MKGSDTLAPIEEREAFERFIEAYKKYGDDAPMYTTLDVYIENDLIVLQDILNN